MPCGMLAVNKGRVSLKGVEAIKASTQAQQALKTLIARSLNVSENTITVFEKGWGGSARQGDQDFMAAQVTVRLTAAGEIEYRDGADLGNPLRGQALADFKGKIDQLVNQLGGAAVQADIAGRVAKVAKTVTQDVVQANGVRRISFRI